MLATPEVRVEGEGKGVEVNEEDDVDNGKEGNNLGVVRL
jgi:hypothetical protein